MEKTEENNSEVLKYEKTLKESQYGYPKFCADTCVIINLANYFLGNKMQLRQVTNFNEDLAFYKPLLEAMQKNEVKLYVPHKVMAELFVFAHKQGFYEVFDFLKYFDICEIDIKSTDKVQRAKNKTRLRALTEEYCKPFTSEDVIKTRQLSGNMVGVDYNYYRPVFDLGVEEENMFDARIMATSVMAGLPLITQNSRHFFNNCNVEKIAYINQKFGYPTSAVPISLDKALEMLKNKEANFEFLSKICIYNPRKAHKRVMCRFWHLKQQRENMLNSETPTVGNQEGKQF